MNKEFKVGDRIRITNVEEQSEYYYGNYSEGIVQEVWPNLPIPCMSVLFTSGWNVDSIKKDERTFTVYFREATKIKGKMKENKIKMKHNIYAVLTEGEVCYTRFTRAAARDAKRELEKQYPNYEFKIVKLVPEMYVR